MQTLTKDPAIPTSLESPLFNLRKVKAFLSKSYDEKDIDVLVWLLENCRALDSMEVSIPKPLDARKDENYIQFLQRVLDSAPATVSVTEYRFV